MKIALLEPIGVSKEVIDELSAPITEKGHEFVYYDTKTTDPAELAKRSEGCDIVMIANNPYPTEVVEKADALKMLSVAFTGIDHIGTDKCKEKNIMICNAAGYSNQTVAELIIGMAIDALRHVVKADGLVRNGGTSAGLGGKEICGRTADKLEVHVQVEMLVLHVLGPVTVFQRQSLHLTANQVLLIRQVEAVILHAQPERHRSATHAQHAPLAATTDRHSHPCPPAASDRWSWPASVSSPQTYA